MDARTFAEKILALFKEHRKRGLEVCDTTLIPDFFDCTAIGTTASKIEDIINIMLG